MFSVLKNRKVRDFAIQATFLAGTIGVLASAFIVGRSSLQEQGIVSGFGFLERSTGFDIGFSLIPFAPTDTFGWLLVVGLLNTLVLGSIGIVLANVLGLIVAVLRTSGNAVLQRIATFYIEIFRNVPIILQLFFWYALLTRLPAPRQAYDLWGLAFASARGIFLPGLNVTGSALFLSVVGMLIGAGAALWLPGRDLDRHPLLPNGLLRPAIFAATGAFVFAVVWMGRLPDMPLLSMPELKGLNFRGGIRIPTELSAMVVTISTYGGAYIAEIVRAGFLSVGRGQVEAAQSLGLKPFQVFRLVRMPLALRAVFPTLINQYVWLFKATTLGIAIGFTDFFYVIAVSINQVGQTVELIAILMLSFLIINNTMAFVLNRINEAIALKGTQARE